MSHPNRVSRAWEPWLFLAAITAGCAGELTGDPSAYVASGSSTEVGCDRVDEIFASACTSCHGAVDPMGGLDLASPGVAERLVGHASTDPTCSGRQLIDPAAPGQSFLTEKLVATAPECGDRMPLIGELSSADLSCIEAWVFSLAVPADGGASPSGSGDAMAQGDGS